MKRLLASSKFLTGIAGIAIAILVHAGMPEEQAVKIVDSVVYIIITLIGATAIEDAAAKLLKKE